MVRRWTNESVEESTLTTSMVASGYLKMQVYCRIPVAEIGSHKVIKTRWVDTNKGDERSPEIRCPLVAKEVKKRNKTEESANFFASTPPLEAVKFLISEAMTRVSRNNRALKLSFIDVKKAHLCSDVLRELCVEPPPEANEPPDIVWWLQRAMYGTRDAAAAWEREWTETLNSGEFASQGAFLEFVILLNHLPQEIQILRLCG